MAHHIFQLESELQNIPEAAPEASRSFSVSEKLARYGSSALSGVEHLTLLVGKKSVALALIRHFGSLKGLARASFQELRLPVLGPFYAAQSKAGSVGKYHLQAMWGMISGSVAKTEIGCEETLGEDFLCGQPEHLVDDTVLSEEIPAG
jgi:hypothetical protein